jgi:hypothetical protein
MSMSGRPIIDAIWCGIGSRGDDGCDAMSVNERARRKGCPGLLLLESIAECVNSVWAIACTPRSEPYAKGGRRRALGEPRYTAAWTARVGRAAIGTARRRQMSLASCCLRTKALFRALDLSQPGHGPAMRTSTGVARRCTAACVLGLAVAYVMGGERAPIEGPGPRLMRSRTTGRLPHIPPSPRSLPHLVSSSSCVPLLYPTMHTHPSSS